MKFHDFIFAKTSTTSLLRHVSFWLAYSLYYTIQSYAPIGIKEIVDPMYMKIALYSTALYLPVCILSTYAFLYLLWPYYLVNKKYITFTLAFVALFSLGFLINCFMSRIMLKLTASVLYPNLIAGISLNNTVNAIIISGFALGIKFSKKWYLQQQLNLTLAKEKKNRELQLLKARIQPSFLFETLNAIRENLPDTKKAIILVVKLSDLLSYTLYECNTPTVLLTRELKCAKNFLLLAEAGMQNKMTVKTNVTDDITDVVIIPMILISFLQNCVLFINKNVQHVAQTDLLLSIKNERLRFELNIKCRNYQPGQWENIVDDVSARLNEDYSRNFSIEKIYKDPELNINLELLLAPRPLVAV